MKEEFDSRRFGLEETVQIQLKGRSRTTTIKYKRGVCHPVVGDKVGLISLDVGYGDIYPWAIGILEKSKGSQRIIRIESINTRRKISNYLDIQIGSLHTEGREYVVSYKPPCDHHLRENESEQNIRWADELIKEGHLCVQLQESFPVHTDWCGNRKKCSQS